MIKSQLVKRLLNKNPHLIQRDVENITSIVLEKITSTLENEGRVEIRGFGSLSVRRRQSKNGRNPRTGEQIQIGASQKVKFLPAKALKEMFNK